MASEPQAQDGDGRPAPPDSAYPVEEIAAAWQRERPGTPVSSIGIVTPIWRLAKLLGDDRRRVLNRAGVDIATLDLLSVLRRSGPPYTLSTRELSRRSMVTAGAISQRVARAEREGLVTRRPGEGRPRSVLVELTPTGHDVVESTVDQVLGREAELLQALSPEQQEQLTGLLRILLLDVQHRLGDDRITQVGED
ncbi:MULTISPECIES: MarR family winged helix-turn-helix transcriptional regulator [Streptomyces]|uniref:MarR family winged helix-turn-helix transcriptional regulator n=1 Tax=Streptomyces TaxID=1883 RepID=UPI0019650ACB|nr:MULTISPECIES: MarR family transcriptional regulator [Streptomyces]QRX91737.1 MarR family transcriptional regulator [Streptomyces noursei]UJB41505.1 MarR family transcriptional regulator [Streptomyces sp. A1-5]